MSVEPAPGPAVRTLFLGSGDFAVPILDALAGWPGVRLTGVVSTPPKPAGRSAELRPTPVAVRAGELGLPLLTPERLRSPEALAAITAISPELLVLADYGRIVPQALLDLPRHGALNLHPSLLPRHRGATPVPAAIAAGDAETGVTLMRMDAGIDTGPIVAQRSHPLGGDEVAPSLEHHLATEAAQLLIGSLPGWLTGTLPAVPQSASGATLTRPLRRDDGRLDGASAAAVLERRVRAYQPWPGAWIETSGGRLLVLQASVGSAAPTGAMTGTLVAIGPDVAFVAQDGTLVLDRVQPAGRRPMTGREYRRGRRDL